MSVATGVHWRELGELVRLERPRLQQMDLAAPWCVRIDGCDHPGMYAVHRGAAHIDVLGETICLDSGDLVLLPRGGGEHLVGDAFGTTPTRTVLLGQYPSSRPNAS